MIKTPTGLRFSERKLYAECPEAREALERLARIRVHGRKGRGDRFMACLMGFMLALTAPLTLVHPLKAELLGLPQWSLTASYLALAISFWRDGRAA